MLGTYGVIVASLVPTKSILPAAANPATA